MKPIITKCENPNPPDPSDLPRRAQDDIESSSSINTNWFHYLRNKYNSFQLDSKLSRLKECSKLEDVLNDCYLTNRDKLQAQRFVHLDDTRIGTRMIKLMGWNEHDIHHNTMEMQQQQQRNRKPEDAAATNDNNTTNIGEDPCMKELHAIWVCRGVVLKCSNDVLQLRECIDTKVGKERFLQQTETHYKLDRSSTAASSTSTISSSTTSKKKKKKKKPKLPPCAKLQEQIGQCVRKGVIQLNEQVKEQIKYQQEQQQQPQ